MTAFVASLLKMMEIAFCDAIFLFIASFLSLASFSDDDEHIALIEAHFPPPPNGDSTRDVDEDVDGLEGSDAGLVSVLESLEFCLKLWSFVASVLEDLSNAINRVHIYQDLINSGRSLLNHSYRAKQEYERTTSFSLTLASEQEKAVIEKCIPELRVRLMHRVKFNVVCCNTAMEKDDSEHAAAME
ncbi:AUGMIN subunit 5 [Nymphaea thermarum]|nr:AUGMIN subunit 5 [Nymphaea thermarum]